MSGGALGGGRMVEDSSSVAGVFFILFFLFPFVLFPPLMLQMVFVVGVANLNLDCMHIFLRSI